jgi:CheY-like chemotaxis protein
MQRRALVVDDEADECEFIKSVLTASGQDSLTLSDTREATGYLRQEKFSVALFDMRMPTPDGLELTRRARESGLNQRTPIIVISDDPSPAAASLAFSAGASFFLYKPVDKTRLTKLIQATEGAIEHERRRFRRIPLRSKVQLRYGDKQWFGETVDLSLDGMQVKGPEKLPSGAVVSVSLFLNPGVKPIQGLGSVVRAISEDRVGIQLNRLSLEESGRLQEFLLPLIFRESQRELGLNTPRIV